MDSPGSYRFPGSAGMLCYCSGLGEIWEKTPLSLSIPDVSKKGSIGTDCTEQDKSHRKAFWEHDKLHPEEGLSMGIDVLRAF